MNQVYSTISASYSVNKNEEFKVFNPNYLNSTDYDIKLKNQSEITLRILNSNDGKMISPLDGTIELIIEIKKEIDNLKSFFLDVLI